MAIVLDVQKYEDNVSTQQTFAVGATLRVYNDYIRVMSDEWALATMATYWDDVAGKIKTATWCKAGTKVDATPEVLEKVEKFLYENALQEAIEKAKGEALVIGKGDTVKVVKGRQGKGVTGKVVVQIQRAYGMGWKSEMRTKVGIATSEEKIMVPAANGKVYENYKDITWAWVMNCELVEVPEIDMESVKERAQNACESKLLAFKKA